MIRDLVDTIQGLDDKVLELVGGNNSLRVGGKTLDDEGENGDFDRVPGSDRVRVLSPGSAALVYEHEGCDHFGEARIVFKEADDEVGEQVDRHCVVRLMVLEGRSPCNQNLYLIWSQVEPVLVRRSAGLRGPGHQNK